MKISSNQKERFEYIGSLFAECFKVLMACLLTVFISQKCPETGETCTFKENFTDLNPANIVILILNFITLGSFTYLYWIETKRQFYFIKTLDVDKNLADNQLETELNNTVENKKILDTIYVLNSMQLKYVKITFGLFITNFILSAWLICFYFYDGFRSVTGLITNFLLVYKKLYDDRNVLINCKQTIGLSTALTEPVCYNTLDEKIKERRKSLVVKSDTDMNDVELNEVKN